MASQVGLLELAKPPTKPANCLFLLLDDLAQTQGSEIVKTRPPIGPKWPQKEWNQAQMGTGGNPN